MDNFEEQQPTSSVGPVILTAIVCLSLGAVAGRYYEWKHNQAALEVGQSIVDVGRKMIEAGKMADGAVQLHQDEELINDENGIVYLRIGFVKVPEAKLEVPNDLHQDIGNPEKDGQAPTADADKWADQKGDSK